jgi:hypothetical protein
MQTYNQLYRPFHLGGLNITPKAGVLGIYYNNSPLNSTQGQLTYHYGLDTNVRIAASLKSFSHVIEPYFNYDGYSKPWIGPDAHYYFYLDDGLYKLNFIRTGLRQSVKFKNNPLEILCDAYLLSYCQGMNYPSFVGRFGGNFEMYFSRFFFKAYYLYNQGAKYLDYINTQAAYTFSKDFAIMLEYRNRGPYAWRKGDYENYFLDIARPNSELLDTSISDQRQTILGKIMLRLSPRVNAQLMGHYGYGRRTEPSYKSTKVDFNFSIGGSWNLKVGYQHSPDNDKFTTNFYLSP